VVEGVIEVGRGIAAGLFALRGVAVAGDETSAVTVTPCTIVGSDVSEFPLGVTVVGASRVGAEMSSNKSEAETTTGKGGGGADLSSGSGVREVRADPLDATALATFEALAIAAKVLKGSVDWEAFRE